MPLFKQLFRGLMAILMGVAAFAFIWLLQADSLLTGTTPYEKALETGIITQQKARIDEAVNALAAKNKFDGEPVKPLITEDVLLQYNLDIVAWWQTALATDTDIAIPTLQSELLTPAFENQENLDARKKQSSNVLVQSLVASEVFLAKEALAKNLLNAVSTAKYIRLIPYAKIAAIALFAAALLMLLLSCLRQFSLVMWFLGLSAALFGTLSLSAIFLIHSFSIPERLGVNSASLKTLSDILLKNVHAPMMTLALAATIGGIALMVAYAIVSRILRKVKAFADA